MRDEVELSGTILVWMSGHTKICGSTWTFLTDLWGVLKGLIIARAEKFARD